MLILHQFSMLKMYTKMKHILDCLLLELCGLPRGLHSGIRGHVSQVSCRSVFVLLSIYVLYYLWIPMSWKSFSRTYLTHLCFNFFGVPYTLLDMSWLAAPFGFHICWTYECRSLIYLVYGEFSFIVPFFYVISGWGHVQRNSFPLWDSLFVKLTSVDL